jgi:hypothetical protein
MGYAAWSVFLSFQGSTAVLQGEAVMAYVPYTTLVSTGTVGPSHDPYGYTKVIVTRGDRTAELYTNGLGMRRLLLRASTRPLYAYTYDYDDTWESRNTDVNALKARLRFRLWVGVDPVEAEHEFLNDPYNEFGASRYE